MWLTIPDIAAHQWSKRYAVASALLVPVLMDAISCPSSPAVLLSAVVAGAVLAAVVAHATVSAASHGSPAGS